jgi:tetratricopeptide (TPR) repeat protein
MTWPRAIGGLLTTLSVVFALSVAAQPRGGGRAAPAGKDGGITATTPDGGAAPATATSSSADGGAPASTTTASADGGAAPTPSATSTTPASVPTFKKRAPPLPPPTPEQVAAYESMRGEAETYQRGANDYKDTITTIITLHYEEKKKSILGGLDNEIGIEKEQLRIARETAIKRLEDFVAKYSGANAQPEATPDAMYRLAALYEERARADDNPNDDIADTLKPAIALYKRVIREFPKYKELAGIFYFLGHALNDARRADEAMQVWRSLVCKNHYTYPVPPADPKTPDVDKVLDMPQDHDDAYWKTWRKDHSTPESLKKGKKEDNYFQDPYPADCAPIPQPSLLPGQEPKYVAEVWWRIGDWEFDQNDVKGGVVEWEPYAVWDYNRAASAYTRSMTFKKPPIFGISLYKYAWTLFKQSRYDSAVREFVHLLNYTDEQEKLTGDPGADFRNEAYTYIAGSLDNVDFTGPPPEEPYIARPDILDTAKSPAEAETKLHVGIDRVQDARIVPQDKKWTIQVYGALALEYRAINQYHNALAVYQLMLDKWPMDPSAPDSQAAMADLYSLLAKQTKVGDERQQYEAKVLDARTALAKYVGDTPWVDANKDNPAALQHAEDLVRTGLKGAAITHTLNGQKALEQAAQTSDPKEQIRLAVYAMQEFKLAAVGWHSVVQQDENAPDAYKSRYFYADAMHQQVRLQVQLNGYDPKTYAEPTSADIAAAKQAAIDVRDSDEDDQFIDNAGLFVVDLADVDRDLAFSHFKQSNGTQGVEPRNAPKLDGPKDNQTVVTDEIPDVIQKGMQARDEYVQRVPPEKQHADDKGVLPAANYAFYAAQEYMIYGHFKEAQDRFDPIYKEHCGKDQLGYEAWKRLIQMSNLQKDAARSRMLAEAEVKHTCAVTDVQKAEVAKGDLTTLVLQNAAFDDANKIFEQAKAAPPGPDRDKLWRQAGGMYEAALRAAPGHKDAPAAAINSAFCYKQVGEFNKAIDLYQLFISNYGSEDNMNRLEKGGTDPDTKQKVEPNPTEYQERVKYLGMAYDALSTTYYGFFAYQKAAESFGKVATSPRFPDDTRAKDARIAMVLYSNLGDRNNMNRMYGVLVDPKMKLSTEKRAEADYLRAGYDYGQWNPSGGEAAGNSAARRQAIATLTTYHGAAKDKPESARYSLESAYRIAKMMQAGGDTAYHQWFKTTIADWEYLKSHPFTVTTPDGKQATVTANDAPYSDYGGEAEFTLVDEQVRASWDYATGHHHYKGNVKDVAKQVDDDIGELDKKWKPLVDHVAQQYGSYQWAAAATARGGSLYDSMLQGLELVVPVYFTPQQEALFAKLNKVADQLDAAGQSDKADQIRQQIDDTKQQVKDKWRSVKDQYIDVLRQKMISRYALAALSARKNNVKDPTVQAGVSRLAYYTDFLGDDKMKTYVQNTPDPDSSGSNLVYVDGEFLQWRSGIDVIPAANGQPAPLPAAP